MSLVDQIESDLKNAMKTKNAEALSALRMLKAALQNETIQKKKDKLEDREVLEVIQKQAKQRKESIESFRAASRLELAAKEERELALLQAYLPKQLSPDEIRSLASQLMKDHGITSKAEMGRLMKVLMPEIKGRADGKVVNEIAQSLLP